MVNPLEKTRASAESSRQDPTFQTAQGTGGGELCDIFREAIKQNQKLQTQLEEQKKKGLDFFANWNESRMKLAFTSFDTSMKYALFEIIYLLNVNDEKYKNWKTKINKSFIK